MFDTVDIFHSDAFSMLRLTDSFLRTPYNPQFLGSLSLFQVQGIPNKFFAVEQKSGKLSIVPFSARGTPPQPLNNEKRNAKVFETGHLALMERFNVSEISGVRKFASTEMETVETKVMEKQEKIKNAMELTFEYMRLAALQGKFAGVDEDNNPVVKYDWFEEFGIAVPAEIDIDIPATADGTLRKKCSEITRSVARVSMGSWVAGTYLMALCGDELYDEFVTSEEVNRIYLNTQASGQLSTSLAWETFTFGGIKWTNYRGTDDNSTIAVPSDKAYLFPVNAPGVFQVKFSPLENAEFVNTDGIPFYSMSIPDDKRQMYTDIEGYSMPAFVCTNPGMLRTLALA